LFGRVLFGERQKMTPFRFALERRVTSGAVRSVKLPAAW